MPKRRTSNREKELKGTDRPDRMRSEPEFKLVTGEPDPPKWIDVDMPEAARMEARREWRRVVRELVENKILRSIQMTMLAHYCKLHARCAFGNPSASSMAQLRYYATEFGFTPASRSKAGGGSNEESGTGFGKFKGEKTG